MTKNIEGTVDDDIAAKLAIGEGRQVRVRTEFPRYTQKDICSFRIPPDLGCFLSKE